MKRDLKDFFAPAAGATQNKEPQESSSVQEEDSESGRKRRRKSVKYDEDFIYDEPEIPDPPVKRKSKRNNKSADNGDATLAATKQKKRNSKRKQPENGDDSRPSEPVIVVTSEDSSETQPITKANGKKKPRLSSDKMSPRYSLENEDQGGSPATANNSLLNYFTKVDKTADVWTPKPIVLQVKADVHDPPLASPEEKKKRSPQFEELKNKLRISLGKAPERNKKKSENPADYDVIICESAEDTVPQTHTEVISSMVDTVTIDQPIQVIPDTGNGLTPVKPKTARSAVKMKHDGTLASFFTIGNRVPKPLESEEQRQARINFLQSGSPAAVKKILSPTVKPSSARVFLKTATTKLFKKIFSDQALTSPAPLPKVSHVRQRDPMHIMWNLPLVDLALRSAFSDTIVPQGWSSVTSIHPSSDPVPESSSRSEEFDPKRELKQLKKETEDPVAQWFKYMKEMKSVKDGHMWSEKYKPYSATHLSLSNIDNVQKFQFWLAKFGDATKKVEKEEYDSGDDFVSGEESCDHLHSTKRAALLTGPSGIGKTALVYAVAKELGYEVLELNASENRSGKRLLNEFSEALQSHKVETNQLANFMDKKGKNKKPVPNLPKKTLILIEDADLVFADNDDGFLSTVSALAASSKRPVVFIANERGCHHLLSKISSQVEVDVHFSSLRHERLNSWLRTICLAEHFSTSFTEIQRLITWVKNCDIRKCLLQLEFSRAGNRDLTRVLKSDHRASRGLWNKLCDIDVASSKISRVKCLELLTLVDVLLTSGKIQLRDDNPCQRHWEVDPRDSTELTCPTPDFNSCSLTEDIACYGLSYVDNYLEATASCFNKTSKREECLAEMERSLLSPHCFLSRSAVALDLSPALREIARSEQIRGSTQTKRNNRYFHYLRPDDNRYASKMDFDKFSLTFQPAGQRETVEDSSLT